MQVNGPSSTPTPSLRAASAAPPQAPAGPSDAVELLGELGNLRDKFAAPHEALVRQRDVQGRQSHALYEKANQLDDYGNNLGMLQPAVSGLAKVVANGKLGELQAVAADSAQQASGNPFATFALSTLKGLNDFTKGGEADWTSAGIVRLAEGLGNDPAQHAAEFDRQLGRELFIGDQARQETHPEPFLQGEFSAANLENLSNWMTSEQAGVKTQLEAAGAEQQKASEAYNATNDELQAHWHGRRQNMGERVELAKNFLAHLDQAEQANPSVLKEMLDNAPAELKAFFPRNVLDSYRAQLKKADGDPSQINWNKLLGQLERTSLG